MWRWTVAKRNAALLIARPLSAKDRQAGTRKPTINSDRDWTQEHAAERCGLVTRHYQKLEAAEINVTLATLDRLGIAFGVDPSDLRAPARTP